MARETEPRFAEVSEFRWSVWLLPARDTVGYRNNKK